MNGQEIMNRIAEELIGQYDCAVEDGVESYRMSYLDMAQAVYYEAVNNRGTVVVKGMAREGLSDGERFQGAQHLRQMVMNAMAVDIMRWGVPVCHDGSDTMQDVMMWVLGGGAE